MKQLQIGHRGWRIRPRIEEVIALDDNTCDCGCECHMIGEEVSERLDIIPARFRVIMTRRPKYAYRSCEAGITQAPARAHIIAGGMPTEATLAHVIVSKYADHLPSYRQTQIYSRQGIDLYFSQLLASHDCSLYLFSTRKIR